ncbi:MAG: TIGR00730 family Rossman fold protein, partial [Anaerolineae bacterium]|nr:TIGR00730 family Rossman fold protein [Anaerolineae bacterium]
MNNFNSICVFCGSSDAVHADYKLAAHQMGVILVKNNISLIYGGGKTGLMGAVADGVIENGGKAIGVIIPSMNTE